MNLPDGSCSGSLGNCGYAILPALLSESDLRKLSSCCDDIAGSLEHAGIRSLLTKSPELAAFVQTDTIRNIIEGVLGGEAFVARSILFDKHRGANWDVVWHQDTTIAVKRRTDVRGFGPWSIKDGIPHVRPPAEILENMITLRIHLDDCDNCNGALHVIPGSHQLGVMSPGEIGEQTSICVASICKVQMGGVMLMRPLLLHSSKKSIKPTRRRVIHLEYAVDELPEGLEWARC